MKTALVLSGGGSRGAYQIGVWQALRELDIKPDIVTGSSVGALNGALIVQDCFESALSVWEQLDTSMVFDVREDASLSDYAKEFFKNGGATAEGLRHLLERHIDEDVLRKSEVAFGLVTVKMKGLQPCELFLDEIPKGSLLDYLLASAACFPAVKSHAIGTNEYIDGGYHDNLPINLAERQGAKRIIAVNLDAVGVMKQSPEELKDSRTVLYISPNWDPGNFLVFDQPTIRRNLRLGYLDAMKAFSFFDGRLYAFCRHGFSSFSKQKNITLKHWKSFFRQARLNPNPAISMGYSRLEKLLESEASRLLTVPVLLETAAELTGKLLDLSPFILYTPDSFHRALKRAANQWFQDKNIEKMLGDYEEKRISLKAEWLKSFDSKTVVLFLATLLKKSPETVFFTASFLPRESIAAFYLMVFDLLP